ncbi:MAG: hypothetical protein IJN50_07325 [Clostridia bacterium]|nr:hypothetical protein [Clostridia bacterium]
MKKIIAIVLALSLVFALTACGSNADELASTTVTTVATTEAEETTAEKVTEVETTVAEISTTEANETNTETTMVATTKRSEYDLYEKMPLTAENLPIQFSATVKEATFNYVPYQIREETGFNFYTVLQVKVDCASQDLVITFPGSETVFPANMPEAVVYSDSQQHAKANYEVDLAENSATMNGFDENLDSIDIIFPARYMSTIDMPVGDEMYEVTCMQVVFTK